MASDPRDFVLFCYGGGGPLHTSALARELSIPTVVIPPEPGNFSAIGMLLAERDYEPGFARLVRQGLGGRAAVPMAGLAAPAPTTDSPS
jgi:N-methylhydantoinase A